MGAILLCGFAKLKRKKVQNLLLGLCIMIMAVTLLNAFILLGKLDTVFEEAYESMGGPQLCALWSNSSIDPELVKQYMEHSRENSMDLEYLITDQAKTLDYISSGDKKLSNAILLELPENLSRDMIAPRILEEGEIRMPIGNEVWITTKLANILKLKVGDQFVMESSATTWTAKVTKIIADPVFGSANTPIYRMWCGHNQLDQFPLPEGRTLSYLEIRFNEFSPFVEENFIKEAEEYFDMPLSDTIYTYERIKGGYTSTYQMIGGISSLVSIILAGMIIVMTLFLIQSDMSEDIRKIGIYKSVGMTSHQIITAYLVGYGALGVAGGVIGSILGKSFNQNILTGILGDLGIFTVEVKGVFFYQLGVCVLILLTILITSFSEIFKIRRLNTSHAIRRGTWVVENGNTHVQKEKKQNYPKQRCSFEFFYAMKGIRNKKARYLFIGIISMVLGCLAILCIGSLKAVNKIDEEPEIWGFIRSDIYITSLQNEPVSGILDELRQDERVNFTYGVHRIYPQYKPEGQSRYQSIMTSLHELPWNDKMNYKCLEGRAPEKENEIGIGLSVAEIYGLGVGDSMELFFNGQSRNYEIVSVFQTLTNYGNIIQMVTNNLDEFLAPNTYGDYMLVLHDSTEKWGLAEELNEKYDGRFTFIASKSNGENLAGALTPALGTLIFILILVTVLITMNLTFILVKRDQYLIGMLKAVGMTSFQILKIYLWRNCMSATIGNTLGILIGIVLMPGFLDPYAKILGLAEYPFSGSVVGGVAVFLLLPICMLLGTSVIIKSINKVSIKQLMESL